MCDLLYLRLQTELQLREDLLASRRGDAIAILLLSRIEQEILKLMEEIYGKHRDQTVECKNSGGFMGYVFKVMHRFGYKQNRGYNKVLEIPTETKLQVQKVGSER